MFSKPYIHFIPAIILTTYRYVLTELLFLPFQLSSKVEGRGAFFILASYSHREAVPYKSNLDR